MKKTLAKKLVYGGLATTFFSTVGGVVAGSLIKYDGNNHYNNRK